METQTRPTDTTDITDSNVAADFACYITFYKIALRPLTQVSFRPESTETSTEILGPSGYWRPAPPTNIDPGARVVSCTLRDNSGPTGTEGDVTYRIDHGGATNIATNFSCPWSGDNYARISTGDAKIKVSRYAVSKRERQGIGGHDHNWKWDRSNWGGEGQIPSSEHPLSILYVIEEVLEAGRPRPDWAGRRVRQPGDHKIYLIDPNGYRRYIPNRPTYENLFRSGEWILDTNITEIPENPQLSDGAFLCRATGPSTPIYLVSNEMKHHITSGEVFEKYHFIYPERVTVLPPGIIDQIRLGHPWS